MAKQKEKKSDSDSEKSKPKPLTSIGVLCRVRGCGEAEASSLLAALQVDEAKLVEAYGQSAAAVELLINEAADKIEEAKKQQSVTQ